LFYGIVFYVILFCSAPLSNIVSGAMLRGEYWNYFRAQFGGVHAIGYHSAESEPIWMKSGA